MAGNGMEKKDGSVEESDQGDEERRRESGINNQVPLYRSLPVEIPFST